MRNNLRSTVLDGAMTTHVLFEGVPNVLVRGADLVMEGVHLEHVVPAAIRAADTANRIELCGGLPVDVAAQVRGALTADIDVRVNRYGFESLEQVAAYKTAFATGDPGDAAFLYAASESTSMEQYPGVLVAGVASEEDLIARVQEARARGAGIIELYGGLGISAAALARSAAGHKLPVGFIDGPLEK